MNNSNHIVSTKDCRTLKYQIIHAKEMYEQKAISLEEYRTLLVELKKDYDVLENIYREKVNRNLLNEILGIDNHEN